MFGLLVRLHFLLARLVLWMTVWLPVLALWCGLFVPLAKGILKIEAKRQESVKARKAAKKARKAAKKSPKATH